MIYCINKKNILKIIINYLLLLYIFFIKNIYILHYVEIEAVSKFELVDLML